MQSPRPESALDFLPYRFTSDRSPEYALESFALFRSTRYTHRAFFNLPRA